MIKRILIFIGLMIIGISAIIFIPYYLGFKLFSLTSEKIPPASIAWFVGSGFLILIGLILAISQEPLMTLIKNCWKLSKKIQE